VSLGASGVFAEVIRWAFGAAPAAARAPRALAWLLVVVHCVASPVLFVVEARWIARVVPEATHLAAGKLFAAGRSAGVVIVVRGEHMFGCTMQLSLAQLLGLSRGRLALCLSGGPSATTVQRLDAFTLLVRPDGGFLDAGSNRLQWDGHRAVAGETYVRPGYRAEVVEVTPDGEPLAVTFRFEYPLDHRGAAWLVWRSDHYDRLALPPIGGALRIDGGIVTPS
jgi:hypothetical protein